eukprot:CAMPEP_0182437496 /NCGR_PEP_ID=MMETSP1167-20130531/85083_1 /TAXON_ID=2988 /ORGANISM="Mallomonas Sp, Strain CCMP3275" /LENGTH=424 /DNA_ID=CAMNT_0024630437 /DNA_START=130 /DNA_END=1401 /DNA_ORIENTATION=-
MKELRDSLNYSSWSGYSFGGGSQNYTFDDYAVDWTEWGKDTGKNDDFFLDGQSAEEQHDSGPNVPSSKYICNDGWVSIRSELNYKYLWLHGNTDLWLSATATLDTPLQRKAFQMVPVLPDCREREREREGERGWMRLREGDSKSFLMMVAPSSDSAVDEWAVRMGSDNMIYTANNTQYHFLLEEEGYIMNRGAMAFLNVMTQAEYGIRGHTSGWDRTKASGREYSASMHFNFVNETDVALAIAKEKAEEREALREDKELISLISTYPLSLSLSPPEKWVISFGLYGGKEKYTVGAIRNAEIAKIYFPGWICRYYVTSDVPETIITRLTELGSEILPVPKGMGYASGMFWRFMVGADNTVDRYIVRDVDSRLNARDRIAVEEWIQSKVPFHILRDHVNHCLPINGGMWGGVKGALPDLESMILSW